MRQEARPQGWMKRHRAAGLLWAFAMSVKSVIFSTKVINVIQISINQYSVKPLVSLLEAIVSWKQWNNWSFLGCDSTRLSWESMFVLLVSQLVLARLSAPLPQCKWARAYLLWHLTFQLVYCMLHSGTFQQWTNSAIHIWNGQISRKKRKELFLVYLDWIAEDKQHSSAMMLALILVRMGHSE